MNDTELFKSLDSHHASKHIRNLPEGYKASVEKIASVEANGFNLTVKKVDLIRFIKALLSIYRTKLSSVQ